MNADLKAWYTLQIFELTRRAIVETDPRRKAWLMRQANKYLDKVS